ncbi:helix-turn-helix transcriptional regulator [Clostridium sp. BJN0001]|uniref:helix-turn-helix domain-containing protein n=1 Tax=Clostridium sp. BJN0001 TaxID=2930219 RepID=UPI001FD4147D|nr:helix-turn-helix transcriptional regulator [Clostridium sp. BJN0001]
MYDTYDSDSYFFINDIFSLIAQKDKESILCLIYKKHEEEKQSKYFPLQNKKDDLLMWNVLFIREIIKNGSTIHFIHTIYNKYYERIKKLNTLEEMQSLELEMTDKYLDILNNSVEITNNYINNKIIGYLYIHLENSISLKDIANNLNLSVGYMCTSFKKNKSVSIMKYYKILKIQRAKTLLRETDKSVLEISTDLSFSNQGNFSRTFKKITGLSPKDYRNKII